MYEAWLLFGIQVVSVYLKHIAIILHAAKLANDLLCCFAKFREIYYTMWPHSGLVVAMKSCL